MTEKPTLENKVDANHSFLKNIWSKGKYLLAAIGAAYVIHGGYHLVQAWYKDRERLDLWYEAFYKANAVSSYLDELEESEMDKAEIYKRVNERLKEVDDLKKRIDEMIKQKDYHYQKALNPFY